VQQRQHRLRRVRHVLTHGGSSMRAVSAVLALALLGAACGSNSTSTTSPSSTATVAAPTTTETWNGTVQIGLSSFFSFDVAVNGTVNVTLVSVSGAFVPATVTLGVAIGTPDGTACNGSATNVQPGATPQVTATEAPGRYCVVVSDVGNLFAPASFVVTIAHP
jgi:hypothetical protein